MPRKLLERSDRLPYHITARANNREEFHLDRPTLWNVIGSECLTMRLNFGLEIHAFVLMPNHFHMLATAPEQDLGVVMNNLMSNLTRRTNRITGRSGHLFGGPYYWSLIRSSRYFGHALKYVYRNPVRARLCETVEAHPFSTLSGLIGDAHLPFPIHFTRALLEAGLPLEDSSSFLNWLNRPFPSEAEKLIKLGLKRRVFDKVIQRENRRADLLSELL
jgi:putative transposase